MKHALMSVLLSPIAISAYALEYAPGQAHHPLHNFTPIGASTALPLGLSPQQVRKAYGIDQIKNQGEGQIIAIVDAYDDPFAEYDLGVFNTTFNLPPCTTANGHFKKIYASGTKPATDKSWASEIALDVEWAHAIAPGATIYLVEAKSAAMTDLYDAIQVAIKMGANVVSLSWGGAESSSELDRDKIFNIPNVTFVSSSGDSGYATSYPAASPYVISVGGSTLMTDWDGNYTSETAWAGSGGGLSTIEAVPAYQQTYPIPNNPLQKRGIPDVSYNAGMGMAVYNSVPDPFSGATGWGAIGGTSAGSPQWSAIIAIANSKAKKNIPKVGALLYKIATNNYARAYHDVTTGQNGSCDYYCQAREGYDYVTGLGSPHTANAPQTGQPRIPGLINMLVRGY